MKYKSWEFFPESTFGGQPEVMHNFYFEPSSIPEELSTSILNSWGAFLSNVTGNNNINGLDYIQRSIDRMRSREESEEWTPFYDADAEWEIDGEEQEDACNDIAFCAGLLQNIRRDLAPIDVPPPCEWHADHDWLTPIHNYEGNRNNVFSKEVLNEWWKSKVLVRNLNHRQTRPIERQMLRGKQVIAYDIASYLITTPNLPEEHRRGLILAGGAGCGKSFVIDALRNTFKENIVLMAPSGRASSNIGGDTIHTALRIGIHGFKDLSNTAKMELQQKFAVATTIIIDEYTMMSCTLLNQVNKRCQEAKGNNQAFGGMTIILVGDPAQLPPVSGKPLWTSGRHRGVNDAAGSYLYHSYFPFAINLEVSNRLVDDEHKPFFEGFLSNLRNGVVTFEQFQEFNRLTSEQHHLQTLGGNYEEFRKKFHGPTSTWYFNSNENIMKHNLEILARLNEPILRINAKHNCNGALKGSEEQTKKLTPVLYISVNSKVMLQWNLATHYNLVNGATGIVRDFLFFPDPQHKPPDGQPLAIVVEFPSYSGPSFFDNIIELETGTILQDRSKWVPIRAETVTWYRNTGKSSRETMERTNFPLCLSWAWTPWKGQGTTNFDPCSIVPGDKEPAAGACYVMVSRVTTLKNLYIPGGISFERLTSSITSHKDLKDRIREEERLRKLELKTIEFYNSSSMPR
jgi:hypothetical protein